MPTTAMPTTAMPTQVAVIGDVHGHAARLRELVGLLRGRHPGITIYQTGDLIDRGPDSKGVLQVCIDEGIRCVIGNHETWLHQYLTTGHFDSFALHRSMKGQATLQSYGVDSVDPGTIERTLRHKVPAEHRAFILGLPLWRKFKAGQETYRLCHASLKESSAVSLLPQATALAVERGCSVDDALCAVVGARSPASVLWTANSFKEPAFYRFPDGSFQVFGHTPTPGGRVVIGGHWVAVDVGCGTRREMLSAVLLPGEGEITVGPGVISGRGSGGFTEFGL